MSAAYHASKGAVLLSPSACMAVDFGRYGIRVNCICPGIIATQMADQLLTYRSLGDDDRKQALLETYEERHPGVGSGSLRKWPRSSFLASDESSFVTGAVGRWTAASRRGNHHPTMVSPGSTRDMLLPLSRS